MMSRPARLHVSFEFTDRTILRVREQQPPWRVVRGFEAPSGELLAHVHNVSGGIFDSDALHWQIDVAPGARAQVTSTGATRIYRSRKPDRTASQQMFLKIGQSAYLEYLPDALIPFAGSRFDQCTRIELADDASLIWWDRVMPGREASGEVFRYESLTSSFEISANGESIAIERFVIEPRLRPSGSLARLGPFPHFASCYVCRAGQPTAYWRALESELQTLADRASDSEILWGVTSLRSHGLVIRGVARSGRRLSGGLIDFWKAAKWSLCGRVATLPRKVY